MGTMTNSILKAMRDVRESEGSDLTNNPYKQIENYQTRLDMSNQEVPEREGSGLKNALMTTLDIIDRPGNAIRSGVFDLALGRSDRAWDSMKQGFKGEKHVLGSDILNTLGVENKVVRGVGGFALDILLDPTSYVTGGTYGAMKKGLTKGLKANALIGGSSGEKAIATKLRDTGLLKPGEDFLEKTASVLGRGIKPLDPAVESVEDRILRRGWDEINPDSIEEARRLMQIDRKTVAESIKGTSKSFGGVMGSLMPGMSDVIRHSKLSVGEVTHFLDRATEAVGRRTTFIQPEERIKMVSDLFANAKSKDADFLEALHIVDDFTDDELRLATLFNTTFNLEGKQAMELGSKAFEKMSTPSGEVRDLSAILDKYSVILEQRETLEGIENAIKYANGLEYVYNKTMKATYLKFMGMPFLNISETLGKGADVLGTAVATSNFVQNTSIGSKLYSGLIDAPAHIFKTGHVTKRAMGDGSAEGIRRYEGAKAFVQTVDKHVRHETALAQKAKYRAETAFAEIIDNPKLRRASAIAVEGAALDAGRHARALWEKTAKELTDEELQIVHRQVVLNAMYSNALREDDMANMMLRVTELGKDLDNTLARFNYKTKDNYIHHIYDQDVGFSMESRLSPRSEAERIIGETNPKRGHMKPREFESMALAEAEGGLKPIYDIVASFTMRSYSDLKSAINTEFTLDLDYMLKNLDQYPGIDQVIAKRKFAGMVQLPGAFDKYYGTPEVKQQMLRLVEEPTTNAGSAYFREIFDHGTNMLKTLQTSMNPSFLLRNMVGETLMNWFAHVSPNAHGIATQIMLDQSKKNIVKVGNSYFFNGMPLIRKRVDLEGNTIVEIGKAYTHKSIDPEAIKHVQDSIPDEYSWSTALSPGEIGWVNPSEPFEVHAKDVMSSLGIPTYKINGKDFTAYEIMQDFYDVGLGWSGVTKGNLIENMQDLVKAKTLFGTKIKSPVETMKSIGDATETWTRLAHFVDRRSKGMDIKSAAEEVRMFHVDYRDLTTVEKNTFRRIAPYYTYMRKNTPIQIRQMMLNPGKFAIVNHLVQESYNNIVNYDPDNLRGEFATPDYLKQNLAIPWDMDNEGNVRYFNWNLPLADVSRIQFDLRDSLEENLVGMLHPVPKAVIEGFMNESMTTEAQIYKYPGQTVPLMSGWEEGIQSPKAIDYALSQMGVINSIRSAGGQLINHAAGQDDPRKPFVGYPTALSLTKSLFPLVNEQQASDSQAYQYRDQLQGHIKGLTENGVVLPEVPETPISQKILEHYANRLAYTPTDYLRKYKVRASDFY